MQYQVPQFIDIEDKIIGPLTIKQFIFLASGLGIAFLLFLFLRMAFAIMLSIPIVAAGFTLAFVKIEGVALPKYLASMLGFSFKPQKYLWRKDEEIKK